MTSFRRQPEGRPCGVTIPKYVNAVSGQSDKNFLRGFYFFADSRQELYGHALRIPGFGSAFREEVHSKIPYRFSITGQGEYLPRHDNYVRLDPDQKDAWGIPLLYIHASYGDNEHATAKRIREHTNEILDA